MRFRMLALFLLPFAIACGGDDATPAGCGTDDDHDHSAKHGGELMTLGDHEGHVEMKLDHDSSSVTIWLSTTKREDLEADEAPVLNFMSVGEPVSVTGKGAGAKWVFTHDALAGEPENGKLRIKIGGRTFTPKLVHSHGDGHDGCGCGHEDGDDHDHDKDHKDDHDGEKGHDHDDGDHDHEHDDGKTDG